MVRILAADKEPKNPNTRPEVHFVSTVLWRCTPGLVLGALGSL